MKNTRLRRFRGNQMNPDYYDFDYDKFVKYICSNLSDVTKNDITIDCDKWGYDVGILYDYDDAESMASWLATKSDYSEFIFDTLTHSTNEIVLKMPIVRATEIAKNFSPKVLKKTDDALYIGDKNSTIKFWVDVSLEEDSDDETYPVWDWNQISFSLDDYNDLVLDYFQQTDDAWYAVDEAVTDSFI